MLTSVPPRANGISMHPILYEFDGIKIHSYGLMIVAGFAVAMWWSVKECKRQGLPPETGLDFATYCLIIGIVVSRLVHVLLNWGDYAGNPLSALRLQEGGLTFHGALLGGILATWLFARVKRINFWVLADVLSPCVLLGYPVARLGCFFNGCCYGAPTTLPWGCVFPDAHQPGQWTPPSHPAQIYSSISVFLLFLIFIRLGPILHAKGQRFSLLLAVFGIDRIFMDQFRRNVTGKVTPILGLTEAQLVSLGMIALSALLYCFFGKGTRSSEEVANTLDDAETPNEPTEL
ncbi:MAG: prolipoprotein diacylglyceryl transferase [Armatimonadetes bacterium CG_4_9_14_3_um_filter_58_7]|nr:MAG: prolipoprotein diacylglyceryl transferase [Armatimonadetes bacterium CG_4_9_14_3_um_filter_58_7]